jgi:ethanolamine utilization protein EutQ (cupin superfamily)
MISAYYAVSDSLKQIHNLLASATSQDEIIKGLNEQNMDTIVIDKESMITKRRFQNLDRDIKEREKRKVNN